MKFQVYLISLVAAMLGTVLSYFLVSLDLINLDNLIIAIVWFLISFMTYFMAGKIKDERWFKLISIDFIFTWIFTTFGVIIGFIIWILIDTGSASINLDAIMNVFYVTLPLAIGPTATASMGLRD